MLDRLRPGRPPAEVTHRLAADDRLLAWAVVADGGFLVASRLGLRLPDGRLAGWHLIDKAVWRGGELSVTEAKTVDAEVLETLAPVAYPLTEPRNLPAVVRSRVTRSVAYTARQALPAGGTVRIVARRIPGRDGLTWSMRFDRPADHADPAVRPAADRLLTEARAEAAAIEPG